MLLFEISANVKFEEDVTISHFNTLGGINGVQFDHFLKSLADRDNPEFIYGFKNFTGKVRYCIIVFYSLTVSCCTIVTV